MKEYLVCNVNKTTGPFCLVSIPFCIIIYSNSFLWQKDREMQCFEVEEKHRMKYNLFREKTTVCEKLMKPIHLVSVLTSSLQWGCAHMYGRFSSSCALLISLVVIGISAACGICILFIHNIIHNYIYISLAVYTGMYHISVFKIQLEFLITCLLCIKPLRWWQAKTSVITFSCKQLTCIADVLKSGNPAKILLEPDLVRAKLWCIPNFTLP